MPLVRIDLQQGKSPEYIRAISEAVQRALVEVFHVPARDRFQSFTEHGPGSLIHDPNYLAIERSDGFVMIQVFLSAGRAVELKRAFYARLVALLKESPGIRPDDVMTNLVEVRGEDWSFGNGIAQYLVLPKEKWK